MPALNGARPALGRRELSESWTASIDDWATCLAWSSDGALVAVGSASGKVFLLDGISGQTIRELDAHPGGVLALSFSPKKRLLCTGGQDGKARLVSADDGRILADLPGKSGWVEHVAFCPDGKTVATSSAKHVRLWSSAGVPVLETEAHESTVTGLSWTRKGDAFVTCCYGGARVFRIKAGAKARHLPFQGSLVSLAQSPDGRVIACGAQDCSVHFWRLPSGRDSSMEGFSSKPKAITFSADSRFLATSGEPIASIWDFRGGGPEGKEPLLLSGHLGPLTELVFHRRGTVLASGAEDAGVLLWDPAKGIEPLGHAFLKAAVSRLVFHPHEERLAGADADGHVACWALPGQPSANTFRN